MTVPVVVNFIKQINLCLGNKEKNSLKEKDYYRKR